MTVALVIYAAIAGTVAFSAALTWSLSPGDIGCDAARIFWLSPFWPGLLVYALIRLWKDAWM